MKKKPVSCHKKKPSKSQKRDNKGFAPEDRNSFVLTINRISKEILVVNRWKLYWRKEQIALELGISVRTIDRWEASRSADYEKYKDYYDAMDALDTARKSAIATGLLGGENNCGLNPALIIFLMKNIFKMTDKQDLNISSKESYEDTLAKILERRRKRAEEVAKTNSSNVSIIK